MAILVSGRPSNLGTRHTARRLCCVYLIFNSFFGSNIIVRHIHTYRHLFYGRNGKDKQLSPTSTRLANASSHARSEEEVRRDRARVQRAELFLGQARQSVVGTRELAMQMQIHCNTQEYPRYPTAYALFITNTHTHRYRGTARTANRP